MVEGKGRDITVLNVLGICRTNETGVLTLPGSLPATVQGVMATQQSTFLCVEIMLLWSKLEFL